MSYLQIQHVGKSFGKFTALHDISFEIPRGQIVTLLGPSGCGKTTLLRAIAGLEGVDSGTIALNGAILANGGRHESVAPEHRGIGMVFQSYALWPHMNVGENIALGLKLKGLDKSVIRERVGKALEMVGLPGSEKRATASMSGGQQQRVSLARALALEPDCILFDEPLSNLDVLLRERMRFEIRELLKAQGITAIYVTHDQSEAMVISDVVMIMNHGRLVQSGSPTELYLHPRTRFVAEFFGRTNLFEVDAARSRPGTVVSSNGLQFPCAADFQARTGTLLGFRPEVVSMAQAGEASMHGEVQRCVYLGGSTQVDAMIAGKPVTATLPGLHRIAERAPIALHVAAEHLMMLETDTAHG